MVSGIGTGGRLTRRIHVLVVALLLLGLSPVTTAADKGGSDPSSPEPGPGCPNAPGGPVDVLDETEERVLWRMAIGERNRSTFPEGISHLDLGDLVAIDNATGQEVWRYDPVGIVVTRPVRHADTVYFGSDLDSEGGDTGSIGLHAVNAESGELRWCFNVPEGINTPVLPAEDKAYFASEEGAIYAIKMDGPSLVWEQTPSAEWPNEFHRAPVLSNDRVIVGSSQEDPQTISGSQGGAVYGFDVESGEMEWGFDDVPLRGVRAHPVTMGGIVFVPVEGDTGDPARVYALNATSGERAWTRKTDSLDVHLVGDGGILYAAHRSLEPLDPQTGRWKWRAWNGSYEGFAVVPPTVIDGRVIVGGNEGAYAFNTPDGKIQWNRTGRSINGMRSLGGEDLLLFENHAVRRVDGATGETEWSRPAREKVRTLYGRPILAGGYLIAEAPESLLGISLENRSVAWQREVGEGAEIRGTAEGRVYVTHPHPVASGDGGAREHEMIAALDLDTGKTLWARELGWSVGSVSLRGDSISLTSWPWVVSLDATDGSVLWNRTAGEIKRNASAGDPTGTVTKSSYVADLHDSLIAIDPETAQMQAEFPLWRHPEWTGAKYEAASGVLLHLLKDQGTVTAVNLETGDVVWNTTVGDATLQGPLLSDGRVFVTDYLNVSALEAESGDVIWQRRLGGGEIEGSAGLTAPGRSGDMILVGSRDGNVYALDSKSGETLWHQETAGRISTTPKARNGVLYAASEDGGLYALQHEVPATSEGDPTSSSPEEGSVPNTSGPDRTVPALGWIHVLSAILIAASIAKGADPTDQT